MKKHSAEPTSKPDAERWGSVHWSAGRQSPRIVDASTFKCIGSEPYELGIRSALKRSAALRQSILKKAFTGQLVPQDPTDEPASEFLERIRKEREGTESTSKKKVTHKKSRTP